MLGSVLEWYPLGFHREIQRCIKNRDVEWCCGKIVGSLLYIATVSKHAIAHAKRHRHDS
jgi:hypothetical protein